MQTIGWIALGSIVGYCVAVVVDWMRKGRIAARLDGEESRAETPADYIDWLKVPEGYDWVAVQPEGSIFQFPAEPNHTEDSHDPKWWYNPSQTTAAVFINPAAIIGPLPDWRESLRHRPGVASRSEEAE